MFVSTRFLHDEVGLYDEDANGKPLYNFSYIDQIYDGLLQNGVRPFVELSFMPRNSPLTADAASVLVPPSHFSAEELDQMADLISAFPQHLIARYGIDEVSQWYFEVWNEPNLDFWAGDPKEQTYYHLYDTTARALKQLIPGCA